MIYQLVCVGYKHYDIHNASDYWLTTRIVQLKKLPRRKSRHVCSCKFSVWAC